MKRAVAATLAFMLSPTSFASSLDVEYKSFYSHVKKLEQEDTQDLQFSFGFKHIDSGELCQINTANIFTQKQTIPLQVTAEQRFTVPNEKALKLAQALVNVDLVEPANKCDMSVQLETKSHMLKQVYTRQELAVIYDQYTAFFNEMGSFLSFLMPSVKGLMVYFDDDSLTRQLTDKLAIRQGVLILNDDVLETLETLELPVVPQRITALAKR